MADAAGAGHHLVLDHHGLFDHHVVADHLAFHRRASAAGVKTRWPARPRERERRIYASFSSIPRRIPVARRSQGWSGSRPATAVGRLNTGSAEELVAVDSRGTTDEGQPVQRFSISGGGLTAKLITFGAVVQDLRLDGHEAPLVLGFDRLRGLSVSLGLFRSDGRPLRQPHPRWPLHPRREALPGGHQFPRQASAARRRSTAISQARLGVALHGADFVTLTLHDPAWLRWAFRARWMSLAPTA